MDFNGQYLLYEEYKELDGTLEKVPFNLLEYDVRKLIDERTFRRLINLKEIPYEVKMCTFKMIDIKRKYQTLEEIQKKAIASENIDGYNVTYRKLEKADIEARDKELEDVIHEYLFNLKVDGIPTLYRGTDV